MGNSLSHESEPTPPSIGTFNARFLHSRTSTMQMSTSLESPWPQELIGVGLDLNKDRLSELDSVMNCKNFRGNRFV